MFSYSMKNPRPHSNSNKVAISSAFDSINKVIKNIKQKSDCSVA